MDEIQPAQPEIRGVHPATRKAAVDRATPATRATAIGAVAFGALALGATAIGALAIGRLAVGAFAVKRGRMHSLAVDNLEVLRLHIRELTIDSGMPR
jgi:hypothetical protein